MAEYITLKNPETNEDQYPMTHPEAVRDENGVSINHRVSLVEDALKKVSVPEATTSQIYQLFET